MCSTNCGLAYSLKSVIRCARPTNSTRTVNKARRADSRALVLYGSLDAGKGSEWLSSAARGDAAAGSIPGGRAAEASEPACKLPLQKICFPKLTNCQFQADTDAN